MFERHEVCEGSAVECATILLSRKAVQQLKVTHVQNFDV